MTISEILANKEHRPWDMPSGAWSFYQEWNDVVFIHWQVDVTELEKWIPGPLEIDTYNGSGWISLVAFTMEKIRPRMLPAFTPVSEFHEINIRTYVRFNGKAGVFFLNIEAGKRISAIIARQISSLPYRFSAIQRNPGLYEAQNAVRGDELTIAFKTGDWTVDKTELDHWLTERYALFQNAGKSILEYEIQHIEWPIRALELSKFKFQYKSFDRLIKCLPDVMHYSPGVQVLAWGRKKYF
jgi:uncharacterized protein YqjF (DUF2071 family)